MQMPISCFRLDHFYTNLGKSSRLNSNGPSLAISNLTGLEQFAPLNSHKIITQILNFLNILKCNSMFTCTFCCALNLKWNSLEKKRDRVCPRPFNKHYHTHKQHLSFIPAVGLAMSESMTENLWFKFRKNHILISVPCWEETSNHRVCGGNHPDILPRGLQWEGGTAWTRCGGTCQDGSGWPPGGACVCVHPGISQDAVPSSHLWATVPSDGAPVYGGRNTPVWDVHLSGGGWVSSWSKCRILILQ